MTTAVVDRTDRQAEEGNAGYCADYDAGHGAYHGAGFSPGSAGPAAPNAGSV
jgi:hypothetical protein